MALPANQVPGFRKLIKVLDSEKLGKVELVKIFGVCALSGLDSFLKSNTTIRKFS